MTNENRNNKELSISGTVAVAGGLIVVVLLGAIVYLYITSQDKEAQISNLKGNVKNVQSENKLKDQYIEEVAEAISQLQKSLNIVGENQLVISDLSSEIRSGRLTPQEAKNKIISSVEIIDSIILSSRERIKQLQAISAERKRKIGELSKTVESLENTIAELRRSLETKEMEVVSLKEEVSKLTAKVVSLTEEVQSKTELLRERDIALRRAYYIIGKEKELHDKKIIRYEGGILGIASTPVVESSLNDSLMKMVDIESTSVLFVEKNIKSVKILTSHDPASFTITEEGENATKITIKDPYRFWLRSKYLVIMYY